VTARIPATRPGLPKALYEHHAEMCKVFSSPIRLMILNVLRETERSVAEVAEELDEPLGTVSSHLLMMKRRRVLVSRKQGKQVFYRVANPRMLQAFDLIRELLMEQMQQEGHLARELARGRPPGSSRTTARRQPPR
jgi:ArsR family transcriptional regulator